MAHSDDQGVEDMLVDHLVVEHFPVDKALGIKKGY